MTSRFQRTCIKLLPRKEAAGFFLFRGRKYDLQNTTFFRAWLGRGGSWFERGTKIRLSEYCDHTIFAFNSYIWYNDLKSKPWASFPIITYYTTKRGCVLKGAKRRYGFVFFFRNPPFLLRVEAQINNKSPPAPGGGILFPWVISCKIRGETLFYGTRPNQAISSQKKPPRLFVSPNNISFGPHDLWDVFFALYFPLITTSSGRRGGGGGVNSVKRWREREKGARDDLWENLGQWYQHTSSRNRKSNLQK